VGIDNTADRRNSNGVKALSTRQSAIKFKEAGSVF